MGKASRVEVLAEDQRHQRFVYRYLKLLGYLPHDIVNADLPAGRGCGEQWVRQHYAKAVAAYRWRSARARTALVVAIDAGRGDADRRIRQLEHALQEGEMAPRAPGEEGVALILDIDLKLREQPSVADEVSIL
jgi:hypothetical protein